MKVPFDIAKALTPAVGMLQESLKTLDTADLNVKMSPKWRRRRKEVQKRKQHGHS